MRGPETCGGAPVVWDDTRREGEMREKERRWEERKREKGPNNIG